jgi:aminoglycoside/choline kinase family phosphotransferase
MKRSFMWVGVLPAAGIQTPTVLAQAQAQGWFLLEDFGDVSCCRALNAENVSFRYRQAFQVLAKQLRLPTRRCGHTALYRLTFKRRAVAFY